MPAQLKAKRSVIMEEVDDYIYQHSEVELLTEITVEILSSMHQAFSSS